MYKYQMVSQV